jgi:hypothetical protein
MALLEIANTVEAAYRGNVKYTDYAFNKTNVYKRKSRNHLVEQVESFRIGDKDKRLENDLLDTFLLRDRNWARQ